MKNQTIFKRHEIKYLITNKQKDILTGLMKAYMRNDEYGKSVICNIYFDTDDYLLIRRSLQKPIYKEKFRIRSYNVATPNSKVFMEMKKKYNSVVYKRRISMKEHDAMSYASGENKIKKDTQITDEIDYFFKLYPNLSPKVFLSYEREALYCKTDDNFRITFDDNILYRNYDLSLCSGVYGSPILDEGMVLMEVKIINSMPLWFSHILSELKIYPTSFSKYGSAYKQIFLEKKGA